MTDTAKDLVVHGGGHKRAPLAQGGAVTAIVPQDIDQAWRLADIIARADMAPRSYDRSQEKIMVGIMHGLEVGLTPMAALQSIAVINGTPSIWGDGAMALVESSGLMENIEERIDGEGENRVAFCIIRRKDRETPIEQHFSIEDAGLAGLLTKDPWQKYPQRMLQMRARSWALRDGFADVLKGLNIREEVEDYVGATPAPPRPERADFGEVKTEDAETAEHEIAEETAFIFTDQYGAVDDQPLNERQFTDRLAAAMDECNVGAALNTLLEHNADALAALFEPAKKTVEKKLKAANKRLRAEAVDNEHKGKPKAKAKPKTKAKTKAKAERKTSKSKAKPKTTETSKATEPTDSEAAEPSTEDDSSEKPPPPADHRIELTTDTKGRIQERQYQTAVLSAIGKAGDVETVDAILEANADNIKALSTLYSKNIGKGAMAREAKLA